MLAIELKVCFNLAFKSWRFVEKKVRNKFAFDI